MHGADRAAARWLGFFLLCLLLVTGGGHTYSSDGEVMLATARALWQGRLAIEVAHDEDRIVLPLVAAPGGRAYGQYPPGQPLLMLPWVAAGELLAAALPAPREYLLRLVVTTFNACTTALLAVMLFVAGRDMGASRRRALLMALLAILTSPLWQHGKTLFAETLLALLALCALLLLRRGRPLLAGCALAYAVVVKYVAVLLYPPLLLFLLLRLPSPWRAMGWFLLPLLAALLVLAALNTAKFGYPLATGYHAKSDVGFSAVPWVGWYGLTLSPGRGLLWYWPPLLLVLAALPAAWRADRALSAAVLLAFVIHVAFFGWWFTWAGENSWGPRYLLPLVPLLTLLLAKWRPRRRWPAYLLAGAGLLVQVLGISIYFNGYYEHVIGEVPAAQRAMSPYYLHAIHMRPHLSPLRGHAALMAQRLLPTLQVLGGERPFVLLAPPEDIPWLRYPTGSLAEMDFAYRLPKRMTPLYSWFWLPVYDFAWCYLPFTGLPPRLALLWLIPLALAVLAAWRLWRLRH